MKNTEKMKQLTQKFMQNILLIVLLFGLLTACTTATEQKNETANNEQQESTAPTVKLSQTNARCHNKYF